MIKDSTKTFTQVFPDVTTFNIEWKAAGLYTSEITDENINLLYYLLYAKYGNSAIANWDENQFKYKVWSIIYQYGPSWQKKLDIQKKVRALTEDDIRTGSKAVYDHAYNPSTVVEEGPNPDSGEITTVNEQTRNKYVKSKLEGYNNLYNLIVNDVTNSFISRFKDLFAKFVHTRPWIFVEEEDV